MGRRTAWDDGYWLPVIAPSGRRERAHRSFPKVMEAEDIARVTGDFAAAAIRYHDLKAGASNLGQLDHAALIAVGDPFRCINSEGRYLLARIGDAVASRNIHSAVLDALRVCKGL